MRCVRNWLLIKKHVWRKEGNFVENATVKIWNLYDTFNVKRNKLLETIGMYTGCIGRASTQICVKYRPTSKSYIQGQPQLCARYFWHDRSTSSQYNIAIEHSQSFFFTDKILRKAVLYTKKKKKDKRSLAPLRWPEMRRHNPGINQARHLRHTRVCSISILRVAVVSRTYDIHNWEREIKSSHAHTWKVFEVRGQEGPVLCNPDVLNHERKKLDGFKAKKRSPSRSIGCFKVTISDSLKDLLFYRHDY